MIWDYEVFPLDLFTLLGELTFENVWFNNFPLSLFLWRTELFNREFSYWTNFDEDCLEFAATADRLLVLASLLEI